MDCKTLFSGKLSKIIFVEISNKRLSELFSGVKAEELYLPIRANRIIDNTKKGYKTSEIPLAFFIEGMFYVLGADDNFRYKKKYIELLNARKESTQFIKKIVVDELKEHNQVDAYILLKGLVNVEMNYDNYDKLILIADDIRKLEGSFKEEEISILDKAAEMENYPTPFIYKAVIYNEDKDYDMALLNLSSYLEKGGKETAEITEFKHNLKNLCNFNKGKEIIDDDPSHALKLFLPLLPEYEDAEDLYYYIAVAYRNLNNCEKAIYYLNEAMELQSGDMKIINELGINYAAIGDFKKAISYLRKAFEITHSIEICTNLIMCYLNIGDMKQAKLHYEMAKKIDADDEIVKEIAKVFKQ